MEMIVKLVIYLANFTHALNFLRIQALYGGAGAEVLLGNRDAYSCTVVARLVL